MGKLKVIRSLVHQSKSFWTLGGVCKKHENSWGLSENTPKINFLTQMLFRTNRAIS